MRRGLVLPFALVLSLALAAGLTELYDGLEAALGQVRLENPAQAVNALNRAQSLLREEGALPPVLRDAALTNLQEARQFVAQKSAVDLEARLLLVRHLVGKALYDAFLQAQGEEKAALGQRLARATGLPPALVAQARSAPPEEARRLLEARYLQAMAEDLGQALAAQSRPQAYLALARAYARYLIVQDSPQSRLKAQDFVQALALVSTGQPFRPEVQRLLGQIQAWRQDLLSSLQPSTPVPPPAQARPPEPAPSPPSGTQASPEAPSAEAETFYTPGWMDERTAQTVRLAARTLGYNYDFQLLEAVEEVRDEIGLAVTALGRGDAEEGRYRLERAFYKFRMQVEPVFVHIHPSLTEAISRSLNLLSQATGIRTLDALTAYEAVEALRQSFLQGPRQDLWLNLKLALLQTAGVPRAVFFLLAGALSFFPLYLLRLTFGGRNVYWNLLGLAFLVLLLPIFAEALSYFGSILADYGNLPALAFLSNLSIGQGLLPYLAWGFTIFLVVALAGAGLRGIAAQFGLLREREPEASRRETTPTLTSETIVEWDEEF
ncbi:MULTISPECIES: hypothetical protein [Thermus]|jgi:hypothetical protein|uniref:hypothetical protein n=1 Tax=Thermus TaxID=270 RepID=UPI001CA6BAE7|nr:MULTISPECIES: hypothetical protein [Thermus]QZY58484.1 hypothetical protein K7H19_09760 [Thermus thermophilus]BDA38538.1 hypothetical protein JCM10941_19030 [Thermus thermophilus]BDE46263.1 hypothetical protein TthHB8_19060 [Thermus thermophilus]